MNTNIKRFVISLSNYGRQGRCDRCLTRFELSVEPKVPGRIEGYAKVRLAVERNLGCGNVEDPEWINQVGGNVRASWRWCSEPEEWQKLKAGFEAQDKERDELRPVKEAARFRNVFVLRTLDESRKYRFKRKDRPATEGPARKPVACEVVKAPADFADEGAGLDLSKIQAYRKES
jgi:hypothetical protein